MAALRRRRGTGERAASACAGGGGAVGDHRDAVRSEWSIGAAPVVGAVEAAVVAGDGMEVEEQEVVEVVDGMCVELSECGGGGPQHGRSHPSTYTWWSMGHRSVRRRAQRLSL